MPWEPEARLRVAEMLSGHRVRLHPVAATGRLAIPFEYYDPREARWRMEPVDVMKALRSSGLLGHR